MALQGNTGQKWKRKHEMKRKKSRVKRGNDGKREYGERKNGKRRYGN
jgi:hypothetical protein